jgi:hypothetical protein
MPIDRGLDGMSMNPLDKKFMVSIYCGRGFTRERQLLHEVFAGLPRNLFEF